MGDADDLAGSDGGMFMNVLTNPLNIFLLSVCGYLLYKIFKADETQDISMDAEPTGLAPMKKKDFTVAELREYDGVKNERILLAVNGKVFDVTNRGKAFYGPNGAYGIFAGRDASRGLALFRLDKDVIKDEYDDLSDLEPSDMEGVREWEMQFMEKYDFVGRLLKDGEEPTDYSDEEETADEQKQKSKDD